MAVKPQRILLLCLVPALWGGLGCSASISGPVAPIRAGDVTVTVKQMRSGALLNPTNEEQGKSVVSETNALVTAHVRNDSPQNPLTFAAPQLGLLWDNGGCRAASFLDKDNNKVPALSLNPGQTKEVSFTCPRFPFVRDRTIDGDPDNDEVRSVSSYGRPAISLGLWVKGQDEPSRIPLLPSDESQWVQEPIMHLNPRWSLSLRFSLGAAPSLTGGAYRSFIGVDVSGMIRRLELHLAWHAYQDAPIALANEGARTVALTPGLGVRFPWPKGQIQLRGGWSWAPEYERVSSAHGPSVNATILLGGFRQRVTRRSPAGALLSIANGSRYGLCAGWTRLYAYGGPPNVDDADMLLISVTVENMWAPGL